MRFFLLNIGWVFLVFFSYFIALYIFDYNHVGGSFLFLSIVFFISYYFFKVKKNMSFLKGFTLVILPFYLLIFITSIVGAGFTRSLVYLFFLPIVFFFGHLFFINKNKLIILLTALTIGFASFIFLPNYINYLLNINSRKTLVMPKIDVRDAINNSISFTENKTIVLDFWTTSCGVCFKKFPEFEELYLKYKENPSVEFYSVNVAERRDTFPKTLELVGNLGYKFPTIFAKSKEEVKSKLGIYAYPEFMIIKNDSIRYQGFLNSNDNIFIYNSRKVLEKILIN